MRITGWLVGGFMMMSLSKGLEAVGDTGVIGAERLPFHLMALLALGAALYCFIKVFRGVFGRREVPSRSISREWQIDDGPSQCTRETSAGTEDNSASLFEADEVFANYLRKREAEKPHVTLIEKSSPAFPVPDARPVSTFGRKKT